MNFLAKLGLMVGELVTTKLLIPWLTSFFKKIKDDVDNGKEEVRAKKASSNLKKAMSEKEFNTAVDNLP